MMIMMVIIMRMVMMMIMMTMIMMLTNRPKRVHFDDNSWINFNIFLHKKHTV